MGQEAAWGGKAGQSCTRTGGLESFHCASVTWVKTHASNWVEIEQSIPDDNQLRLFLFVTTAAVVVLVLVIVIALVLVIVLVVVVVVVAVAVIVVVAVACLPPWTAPDQPTT